MFEGLGELRDYPYTIKLNDDASPVALTVPRRVPYPLLPKVKAELDGRVEQGVISKVERPTDWCSGLIIVPKAKKTDVRLCVDLTQLNKAVKREFHPMSAVDDSLAKLSNAASVKEQATSGKEQATSVKEQATSVKEQTVSVKEQAASVKEHAASGKEQAASVKEQATSVKEQATSEKEQAASGKEQAAAWNERAPLANGYSPVQVLMGRQLRSTVPAHAATLKPSIPDASHLRAEESIQRGYQKTAFDTRHRALELPPLETGAQVWIKDANRNGVVTGQYLTIYERMVTRSSAATDVLWLTRVERSRHHRRRLIRVRLQFENVVLHVKHRELT